VQGRAWDAQGRRRVFTRCPAGARRRGGVAPGSASDLTLAYESLDLAAEPGHSMTIYTAEPGSASEEGLRLLASLAAMEDISRTAPNTTD
jgi:hypothetical protein